MTAATHPTAEASSGHAAAPELQAAAPELQAAAPELQAAAPELRVAAPELKAIAEAVERTRALLLAKGGGEGASPLDHIARTLELSSFESDVLLLCAAVELDAAVPELCAAAQGDARLRHPTFRLAFAALAEPHWSAVVPQRPLRAWRLIEVSPGEPIMSAPLRIDEWVLHYLMGVSSLDDRLEALVETIDPPQILPASFRDAAEKIASVFQENAGAPVAILCGNGGGDKQLVTAAAAASCRLCVRLVDASRLPAAAGEREGLARLLDRDALLNGCAVLLQCAEEDPAMRAAATAFAERYRGPLAIAAAGRVPIHSRVAVTVHIDRPLPDEQAALWRLALGEEAAARCNGDLERVAGQFSFDSRRILETGRRVRQEAGDVALRLWSACREEARPQTEGLAQRVESTAAWDDLVLPDAGLDMLRAMVSQVRHRDTVLRHWGLAERTARGLGVSALFHGQSGTGKTLAAEVIANTLGLDLVKVDLSQVVSKYIGETEKNLRAVFDAAETTGAVILFDEADALFGKRSEVRDSHDRYANIEVGYLLQRMETYRGVAVLTTNMKGALDPSFLRRLRFLIHFPFPDQSLRRRIWERVFPPAVPVLNLEFDKLARLNLPGGNIRNIALGAAYEAAGAGEPVQMKHLLTAARRECAKLDRAATGAETGGWV